MLVEKPPAMRAAEMDELVALAAERDLVLMPGHLLLYHPGVRKLKELVDAGELGEVLCVYGNRQNLGIVRTNENALWSLGVHDLSVILYLLDEEPAEAVGARQRASSRRASRTSSSATSASPRGKIAHMHLSWLDPHKMRRMTVVGREKMVVFDDMELERKVTVYEKAAVEARRDLRRVADAHRRHLHPEDRERRSRCGSSATHFLRARRGRARDRAQGRARRGAGSCGALERLDRLAPGSAAEVAPDRRRLPGHGARRGVQVLDDAVVGKQPSLSPRSTAKREPLPPAELGAGHDRLHRRDRLRRHDGRRARDRRRPGVRPRARRRRRRRASSAAARWSRTTRPSARGTKIQADAYITAYSTLEEDVFIAPCVVTTNDNFMGRTERRHELVRGPDDPPQRAGRRRRRPLPRRRDRRGGVRRRRRGRDPGRAAARARRRSTRRACCATSTRAELRENGG